MNSSRAPLRGHLRPIKRLINNTNNNYIKWVHWCLLVARRWELGAPRSVLGEHLSRALGYKCCVIRADKLTFLCYLSGEVGHEGQRYQAVWRVKFRAKGVARREQDAGRRAGVLWENVDSLDTWTSLSVSQMKRAADTYHRVKGKCVSNVFTESFDSKVLPMKWISSI